MTKEIKLGDRVKVEFEGEVIDESGGVYRVRDGLNGSWFHASDLTVIPQPIVLPTEHGYYESKRRQLWVHNEDGWCRGGVGYPVHTTSLLADHAPFRRLVLDLPEQSE